VGLIFAWFLAKILTNFRMKPMVKLKEIKPLLNYQLWLKYDDGVEGIVDFSKDVGKGVFAYWNDPKNFEKVHIGGLGELSWSDKLDICSDAMYFKITGKKPEEIFIGMKGAKAVA
jgi:hypothetical protein